ncbi:MAG: dihydroneopterin aldolase [Acidimicrobiales bacterium]
MTAGADRIEIKGLTVVARHGVLEEEHERPQPFEIDVVIEADLAEAARSDDLTHTVDYGKVTGNVVAVATGEHFQLLETLADRIASVVLREEKAEAVTVTVRKLRPPIAAALDTVGVSLRRSRGTRPGGTELPVSRS